MPLASFHPEPFLVEADGVVGWYLGIAAVSWQFAWIVQACGMPVARVQAIIVACAEAPTFGLLGEARVNVFAGKSCIGCIELSAGRRLWIRKSPSSAFFCGTLLGLDPYDYSEEIV